MKTFIQCFILFVALLILVENLDGFVRMFETRNSINKSVDKARKALKGN